MPELNEDFQFNFRCAIIIRTNIIQPKFFRKTDEEKEAMLDEMLVELMKLAAEYGVDIVDDFPSPQTTKLLVALRYFFMHTRYANESKQRAHLVYFLSTPSAYLNAIHSGNIASGMLPFPYDRRNTEEIYAVFNWEFTQFCELYAEHAFAAANGDLSAAVINVSALVLAIAGHTKMSVLYNNALPDNLRNLAIGVFDEDTVARDLWTTEQQDELYSTFIFCNMREEEDINAPSLNDLLDEAIAENMETSADIAFADDEPVAGSIDYEEQNIDDPDA